MFTLREAQRGRCVSGRWERARVFVGEEEERGRVRRLLERKSKSFVSRLLEGAACSVNSIKR